MLRAQYERRGPVPQDVIKAVEFEVRGRRDYRNRGKGIVGSRPSGRSLSGNAIVARVARFGTAALLSLGDSDSGRDHPDRWLDAAQVGFQQAVGDVSHPPGSAC